MRQLAKARAEYKAGCLAQCRAQCTGHFKQRNKNQQPDRKVHRQRMKAAEKLLPVSMRMTVEPDQPWQR